LYSLEDNGKMLIFNKKIDLYCTNKTGKRELDHPETSIIRKV